MKFDILDVKEATKLEVSFLEEELFNAFSDLYGDKIPSPNSFSMMFQQFNWDFVKKKMISIFRDFHEQGRFVKSLNATFFVFRWVAFIKF